MPGAAVPAAGAIGLDTVTNAQQETNLENLAEAVRRMIGVGVSSAPVSVISAGVIAPAVGIVRVDTEGATPTDNLDRITPTAYLDDSLLLLFSTDASRDVTLRNLQGGSGQLGLFGGASFTLTDPGRWILLRYIAAADLWLEMDRSFGSDFASYRSHIGLGTVATLNDGAVDAATLDGNLPSAFLAAGGTAANSTLLGGLAVAAFLRADLASLQTIAGSLRAASGRLEAAIASAAGTAILSLLAGGVERTQLFFDGTAGHATLRLLSSVGAVQAGIRFRPSLIPDYWDGAAWVPLFTVPTPSPWLDRIRWDKLDGITTISGSGRTVIHSANAPVLPGSGASRTYRISAGITGERGSGNAEFRAEIYAGPNGDDTDTQIVRSPEIDTPIDGDLYLASISGDFTIPASAKITLILFKDNAPSLNVQPSVAGTYQIDELRTYLRVEQIG